MTGATELRLRTNTGQGLLIPGCCVSGLDSFGARAAPVEGEAEQDGEDGAGGELEEEAQLVGGAAGREERDDNAEEDYEEAEATADPNAGDASGDEYGVGILVAVFAVGELDDGGKHIEEGDEVEDDAGVDELLVGALHRLVDLAAEEDGGGDGGLDEDGDPGSFPAGVDFAEGGGEVAVDADYEGDAGDSGDG